MRADTSKKGKGDRQDDRRAETDGQERTDDGDFDMGGSLDKRGLRESRRSRMGDVVGYRKLS